MCTAMMLKTAQGETFFGRTMDFSYLLEPQLFVSAAGCEWDSVLKTSRIRDRYSFIGIGQDISQIAFADGVNEAGFTAAALYFPGYAHYSSKGAGSISVGSIDLVRFLLGSCSSVEEARRLLPTVRIIGIEDSVTRSVAPLHWSLADQTGKCLVVEQTKSGMHLFDNPLGVLSNSPDYPWHVENLRNYMDASPEQPSQSLWGSFALAPFGQGAGTYCLPGGYTPPARFVRTAFQKAHVPAPADCREAVNTCFHIMESVSIPKGIVVTDRGTCDFTQYTAFINTYEIKYYFRTYDHFRISTAGLTRESVFQADKIKRPVSLGKLAHINEFNEFPPLS